MILDFSFSNFGPVNEEITISFEATTDDSLEDHYIYEQPDGTRLLKLGIIYGPNASGKTTILNALQMLRDLLINPLDQKSEKIDYKKHLLGGAEEENTTFKLTFFVDAIKYEYAIEFNYDNILFEKLKYYPNNREALFFERIFNNNNKVSKIDFGSTLNSIKSQQVKRLEANTINNVSVFGSYLKTNVSIPFFDKLSEWFKNGFLPIISPEDTSNLFTWTSSILDKGEIRKDDVVEFLRRADLNISNLNIIEDELDIDDKIINKIEKMSMPEEAKSEIIENKKIRSIDVEFEHTFSERKGLESLAKMVLPKELESNGTRRYYQLIGPILVAIKKNGFLFIDELESSLHPDLIKSLILSFIENSNRSQLLFTTHNISLLGERDILRNDTIWFTEKNEYGSTDLYSLADFKSDQIRKTSSILNAYSLGKLGAKPKTTIFNMNLENG